MRSLVLSWPSPRILGVLGVCVVAAVMASCILWSTRVLEGQWLIAVMAGASILGMAIASGRFERFLLGLLFLAIPFNSDANFTPGVSLDALGLPGGTPTLGISVIDLILCLLYPMWIVRLLSQRQSLRHLWPPGASPLMCLIGWAALSLVNAQNQRLSLFLLVGLIKAFLCFFYLVHNIKTRKDLRLVAYGLIVGLILESLLVLVQHAVGSNLGLKALGERTKPHLTEVGAETVFRPGGTLGHPNFLGSYLVAVLPVAWALNLASLRLIPRLLVACASVLGTVALVLTLSRSAWFSAGLACLGLFGWLLATRRIRLRLGPALLLTVLLASTLVCFVPLIKARWLEDDGGAAASRLPQNRVAISMITHHPVVGVGLNNYNLVTHLYQPYIADLAEQGQGITFLYEGRVHNVYLLLAAEIGLMGLVWVGWLVWLVVRRGWLQITASHDDLARLALLGMLLGFLARLIHEAVHTGHLATNPFFWIYPAILVARRPPADG